MQAIRCNIAIILRPEDRNKVLNVMDKIFDGNRPRVRCPDCCTCKRNVDIRDIFPDCEPNGKPILQIYCHWNGHPKDVGSVLVKNYNSYEKALALILCGDLSILTKFYAHPYALGEGEDLSSIAPIPLPKTKADILSDYLYLFDYKSKQWFVKKIGCKWFKPISEVGHILE